MDVHQTGLSGTVINNIKYADATVIIAESEKQLQSLNNIYGSGNRE